MLEIVGLVRANWCPAPHLPEYEFVDDNWFRVGRIARIEEYRLWGDVQGAEDIQSGVFARQCLIILFRFFVNFYDQWAIRELEIN